MNLRFTNSEELAEALYYAHAAARLVLTDSPSAEPPDVDFVDLDEPTRARWRETAKRLEAIYRR
jgi:hypothetical protein